MKILLATAALAAGLGASLLDPTTQDPQGVEDMKAMMEKAKRYTQPGPHHLVLQRFVGDWDTETVITMGGKEGRPERGTATFEWLMEGRWLQGRSSGKFMGTDLEGFNLMGYDNFKMSYVITAVNSMDTAMLRFEGDMDPGGKALIAYGTLDEYLTGEHDKMVKSVYRFPDDDHIVLEVHDLPIGESNTKVFEIRYTRRR